uniref:Uncharacterized protein n=1 Tax=Rhizophora mucronata TaxID=61149 RepID=A0A2P2R391_RHIMU
MFCNLGCFFVLPMNNVC